MATHKPPRRRSPAAALRRAAQAWAAARAAVRRLRQRLPPPVKLLLRRTTRWTLHSFLGVLIALVLIFVAARVWLPTLAERKAEIESYLTATVGNRVAFDSLATYWDGLNPGVRAQGFRVYSKTGREPAVGLREVRLSLAWWPLLRGSIAINSLVLVEPRLAVERQPDGRLRVTGIEVEGLQDPAQQDFSDWLFEQREMVIENGELEWVDHAPPPGAPKAAPERLSVQHVYATLRNDGDRHRFDLRAAFPKALCGDCRLSADLTGHPLRDEHWHGTIALQAQDLTLAALPRALRAQLPEGLDGRFSVRLDSRWRDGLPEAIDGRVAATGMQLPLPGAPQPVAIRAASASVAWKGAPDEWRLDLRQLRLGLTVAPWTVGQLRLDYRGGRSSLYVDHLNVGDLAAFAAGLPGEGAWFDWLRAARPDGSVDRLRLALGALPPSAADYEIEADLRNIRFGAHARVPGISGLAGHLRVAPDGGELEVASGASRLLLPRVFRDPIELARLAARLRWRRGTDDWLVSAGDIVLANRDGRAEGELELRLPDDAAVSPVLKLRMDVRDGDGAHAERYYPLVMPEALRAYLAQAVVGGRVTEGSVVFHGALRNFPFLDGKGKFEVRAHVTDGIFEYLPDWAPIRDIDADLYFTGTGLLITSDHGRVRGLETGRVAVAIDNYFAPDVFVEASGQLHGPLQDALEVLADSRNARFAPYLAPGLRAEGGGVLTLDLRIPTHAPSAFTLAGDYRFLGSAVAVPPGALRLDGLRGALQFSEAGLSGGDVRAQLLGGETAFEAGPDPAGGTRVGVRGTVTEAGLARAFGPGAALLAGGEVPWQVQARLRPRGNELRADADLRAFELRLPAPLAKARGEPLALAVRTVSSGADSQVLDLQAGGRASGRLAFQHGAGGWTLSRGRIGIGERVSALPAQGGLMLSARLPSLNADSWWALLRGHAGGDGGFGIVSRVSAEVDALEAFGRPFGQLSVDFTRWPGSWHGRLQGEAVSGQAVLTPSPGDGRPAAISLTLDKLVLPRARTGAAPLAADPRRLPALDLRSQAFAFADKPLGALEFGAAPVAQGWRIHNLKITAPDTQFSATGLWEADPQGHQATRLEASLNSTDFGRVLALLGYPDELIGGRLVLGSKWSWPGSPGDLRMAVLDGELDVSLAKGRLPKISPGAGRVLGVLDLRSATRYLALDFSNVFGKGLAFDSIKGKATIEQGDASTRELLIRAPGADIDLSGRVGLVTRDLDLRIGVTPRLMEELAITGGLLGGPAVGAAVAVLHNLVKKPLEKNTRVLYTVRGGWDDPVVERAGGPAENAAPGLVDPGAATP